MSFRALRSAREAIAVSWFPDWGRTAPGQSIQQRRFLRLSSGLAGAANLCVPGWHAEARDLYRILFISS